MATVDSSGRMPRHLARRTVERPAVAIGEHPGAGWPRPACCAVSRESEDGVSARLAAGLALQLERARGHNKDAVALANELTRIA
jgi:hypothetical protein